MRPRVFFGSSRYEGQRQSLATSSIAPAGLFVPLSMLLFFWAYESNVEADIIAAPYIYTVFIVLVVMLAIDKVNYRRHWVCGKCGTLFKPQVDVAVKRRQQQVPQFSGSYLESDSAERGSEEVHITNTVDERVAPILLALNEHRIRATYGAVGGYLGIPAISVGRLLGLKNPISSWVVSASTGLPTGYRESECHPDLTSRSTIIDHVDSLKKLIDRS